MYSIRTGSWLLLFFQLSSLNLPVLHSGSRCCCGLPGFSTKDEPVLAGCGRAEDPRDKNGAAWNINSHKIGVSISGTPKSSISMGFSMKKPSILWDTPIYGNPRGGALNPQWKQTARSRWRNGSSCAESTWIYSFFFWGLSANRTWVYHFNY